MCSSLFAHALRTFFVLFACRNAYAIRTINIFESMKYGLDTLSGIGVYFRSPEGANPGEFQRRNSIWSATTTEEVCNGIAEESAWGHLQRLALAEYFDPLLARQRGWHWQHQSISKTKRNLRYFLSRASRSCVREERIAAEAAQQNSNPQNCAQGAPSPERSSPELISCAGSRPNTIATSVTPCQVYGFATGIGAANSAGSNI